MFTSETELYFMLISNRYKICQVLSYDTKSSWAWVLFFCSFLFEKFCPKTHSNIVRRILLKTIIFRITENPLLSEVHSSSQSWKCTNFVFFAFFRRKIYGMRTVGFVVVFHLLLSCLHKGDPLHSTQWS